MTLREILARVEWIIETLGDGDVSTAVTAALNLRDDLLGAASAETEGRVG